MEFLIKATDAFHIDQVKNQRGCYKRGDPVVAVPDGHVWGRLETTPRFWKVRVLNIPRFIACQFLESEYEGLFIPGVSTQHPLTRRSHRFMPEMLTRNQKIDLFAGEIVNLAWSDFVNICQPKSKLHELFRRRAA